MCGHAQLGRIPPLRQRVLRTSYTWLYPRNRKECEISQSLSNPPPPLSKLFSALASHARIESAVHWARVCGETQTHISECTFGASVSVDPVLIMRSSIFCGPFGCLTVPIIPEVLASVKRGRRWGAVKAEGTYLCTSPPESSFETFSGFSILHVFCRSLGQSSGFIPF